MYVWRQTDRQGQTEVETEKLTYRERGLVDRLIPLDLSTEVLLSFQFLKILERGVYRYSEPNTYLLLAECSVRTASYGPSFFLPFMAQARSARAMKTRKEKTRIHNLPYGPSKQG